MLVGCFVNVVSQQQLIIPMVNVDPSAVTVYKETCLASFIPIHNTFLLEQEDVSSQKPFGQGPDSSINLGPAYLTEKQKAQMQQLLAEFSDVFLSKGVSG